MKKSTSALALAALMSIPAAASARPVTLTTTLNNYGGNGAYLAFYLIDKNGAYKGSLWMSGGRVKYYRHMRDWMRASGGNLADIRGLTGASTGAGQTLTVTLDLANTMIDAGYDIHIDAGAENMRESPSEIVVPLKSSGSGKAVKGKRFIKSFQFKM